MSQLSDGSALHVPFFDLAPSHEPLKGDILEAVTDLLGSGAFTNGPQVAAFEDAFAAYCGTAHCVGMASGLDALRLTLQALGLEPGDEVLVPAMTFIATFEAVTQAGRRSGTRRRVSRTTTASTSPESTLRSGLVRGWSCPSTSTDGSPTPARSVRWQRLGTCS